MATRINLRDGSQALVQASIEELQKALHAAIQRGQLLQIEGPGGQIVVINPQEIVSAREEPEAAPDLARQLETAG
jgi:hypothetical protein